VWNVWLRKESPLFCENKKDPWKEVYLKIKCITVGAKEHLKITQSEKSAVVCIWI